MLAHQLDLPLGLPPGLRAAVAMLDRNSRIGEFFIAKYRQRAAQAGFHTVALQLRKQGVPLDVARLILLGVA